MSTQRTWIDPLAGDGKDRSHVLSLPYWTLFVRIAQIVVAVLILILTAYAASTIGPNAAGFGLTWFTFILTLIYFIYLGVSLAVVTTVYHPLVHLPFEILLNIFWLCSWAVLASEAASVGQIEDYFGSDIWDAFPPSFKSGVGCLKASAGIGALEWLLFIATLVPLVISFMHSTKSSSSGGLEGGVGGDAVAAESKPATELQSYSAPVDYQQPAAAGPPPVQHPTT